MVSKDGSGDGALGFLGVFAVLTTSEKSLRKALGIAKVHFCRLFPVITAG